ncbi:hypothetical protein [Aquimarina mytili]|uniref:Uncharacterized protein n=1 Tax=Aquimarina mytili TaxID=874423 RepID=A0A937DDI1_9FLAO|nr:hypothetical protein [Aquimarina mytili]MBL0686051.1 hypothetical protein [Aquimarina mytili]
MMKKAIKLLETGDLARCFSFTYTKYLLVIGEHFQNVNYSEIKALNLYDMKYEYIQGDFIVEKYEGELPDLPKQNLEIALEKLKTKV